MARKQFSTFFLNGLYFGVDVLKVQEVIRFQSLTSVPLAPHAIRGLINLRGQIVAAIDLRRRLSLPDREPSARPPINVVVKDNEDVVSLLVDEIADVISLTDAIFEPPPETVTSSARELILGAYKLEHRLLLELDISKTANLAQEFR